MPPFPPSTARAHDPEESAVGGNGRLSSGSAVSASCAVCPSSSCPVPSSSSSSSSSSASLPRVLYSAALAASPASTASAAPLLAPPATFKSGPHFATVGPVPRLPSAPVLSRSAAPPMTAAPPTSPMTAPPVAVSSGPSYPPAPLSASDPLAVPRLAISKAASANAPANAPAKNPPVPIAPLPFRVSPSVNMSPASATNIHCSNNNGSIGSIGKSKHGSTLSASSSPADEGYASWEDPSPVATRIINEPCSPCSSSGVSHSSTACCARSALSPDMKTAACCACSRRGSASTIYSVLSQDESESDDGHPMIMSFDDHDSMAAPAACFSDMPVAQIGFETRASEANLFTASAAVLQSVAAKKERRVPSQTASRFLPELLNIVLGFVRTSTDSPREAQLTILSACLVNRHWHRYSLGSLWEQPYLATEAAVMKLAHACIPRHVEQLLPSTHTAGFAERELYSHTTFGDGSLIRKLDLGRVRLHEPSHTTALRTFGSCCRHLRLVRLWCESLDIFTLQHLATASPYMDTLIVAGHLGRWIDVCDSSLAPLASVVARLATIQIDVGFDGDTGRNRLVRLVTGNVGPKLRHIRLAGSDDDASVAALCERCPNVQVLLYGWANLTEAAVFHIASHAPDLRVLDVRGCQKAATPAALTFLARQCRQLESIDLSFTSGGDAVLAALADNAVRLHTAILAGYMCAESTLVRLITTSGPRLRVLSIAWFGGVMTDATVEAMARHCPNLEKLDIRGCRNVSEAALRALVDNCPHLSVLKLEGPGGWETTSSLAPMRPSRSVLSSSISSATSSGSIAHISSLGSGSTTQLDNMDDIAPSPTILAAALSASGSSASGSSSPSMGSMSVSSSSASSMASMSVPSSPSPLPPRSRRPPRVVLSQAELSRRAFLNELKRRFPSDELVRLEESVL